MVAIKGSNAFIGVKVASTFGTATAIGTNDKIEVESLNHGENAEELSASPIGSGDIMANESQRGATSPSVEIEKIAHFNDAGNLLLSQFMGACNTSIHSTGYVHSILNNETFNAKWVTAAFEASSLTTFEYPSCAVTRYQMTAQNPPDYVRNSFSLIGNKQEIASVTNTNATMQLATIGDTERIVLQPDDEFLINAQAGGALTSPTDRKAITSAVLELSKDQEHVREIKGSSGNSEPVSSGTPPFMGTLTVTFRTLADLTYFTAAQAGTEYKASLTITGSTALRVFQINLPRLKIIADPTYNLTTPSDNELTVVFKCLVAASNPTSMIDRYPYFRIINNRSTSYLV